MSEKQIDCSIVIVNWNTVQMLDECIASILANSSGFTSELIVVDNASTDNSVEMVQRKYSGVVLIKNEKNLGFAAANNQAIAIAKGVYVLLLNSDTIICGDVLRNSVLYMNQNTEVGAMGCRVLNTDGSMQPTCSNFPSIINLMLLTSGLWKLSWPSFFDRYQLRRWDRLSERDVEVISGCYLLTRRTVIQEIGLLDENFFFFGEETDWCRRMRNANWKLRFAPVGQIIHHGGGSVRKLSYQRDLMLSSAMVKLHLKYSGKPSAIAVWAIVNTFNISRAAFWTLVSLVTRSAKAQERRSHFTTLACSGRKIWPAEKTWSFSNG